MGHWQEPIGWRAHAPARPCQAKKWGGTLLNGEPDEPGQCCERIRGVRSALPFEMAVLNMSRTNKLVGRRREVPVCVRPNVRAKLTRTACKTGRVVQREHKRCAASFASRVGSA